jgi:hypothetical protein
MAKQAWRIRKSKDGLCMMSNQYCLAVAKNQNEASRTCNIK